LIDFEIFFSHLRGYVGLKCNDYIVYINIAHKEEFKMSCWNV